MNVLGLLLAGALLVGCQAVPVAKSIEAYCTPTHQATVKAAFARYRNTDADPQATAWNQLKEELISADTEHATCLAGEVPTKLQFTVVKRAWDTVSNIVYPIALVRIATGYLIDEKHPVYGYACDGYVFNCPSSKYYTAGGYAGLSQFDVYNQYNGQLRALESQMQQDLGRLENEMRFRAWSYEQTIQQPQLNCRMGGERVSC